jgi:hypothetical protein
MEIMMLTEKDMKIIGIFLDCLKNGIMNAISAHEYAGTPGKHNSMVAMVIPLRLTGLIEGFVIAELSIESPVTVEKKLLRHDQRLTRRICREIMAECGKNPVFRYQYVVSAHLVRHEDLMVRLRKYTHCVKFEQQLPFGKLTFYAVSIDRMLETDVQKPANVCDVQSDVPETVAP